MVWLYSTNSSPSILAPHCTYYEMLKKRHIQMVQSCLERFWDGKGSSCWVPYFTTSKF